MNEEKLARFLGWFSIALGLTEVVAPKSLGGYLGMENRAGLIRAFGFREIGAGIGILLQPRPVPWLWARVGGDGLDMAALSSACAGDDSRRVRAGVALGMVAGITALDILCAQKLSEGPI